MDDEGEDDVLCFVGFRIDFVGAFEGAGRAPIPVRESSVIPLCPPDTTAILFGLLEDEEEGSISSISFLPPDGGASFSTSDLTGWSLLYSWRGITTVLVCSFPFAGMFGVPTWRLRASEYWASIC